MMPNTLALKLADKTIAYRPIGRLAQISPVGDSSGTENENPVPTVFTILPTPETSPKLSVGVLVR